MFQLICVTLNRDQVQIIYKAEYCAKMPYELVSGFNISACDFKKACFFMWYGGELNFTAKAKFTFETRTIVLNQKPIHKMSGRRIRKYCYNYALLITDEEMKNKKVYNIPIVKNWQDDLYLEYINDLEEYDLKYTEILEEYDFELTFENKHISRFNCANGGKASSISGNYTIK
jgi:hypothetical protein